MKKLVAMALSLTLAVSMLTACGGGTKETKAETSAETTAETSGETKAAADGESLKVALCVTGSVNDMGFCQSAYEGLVLLEEKYGAEIAYTENLQAADMAAAFTDYAAIDFIVVPGVAFDAKGNRLGRGKGYYDRLLPRIPSAYKAGICFPFQLVEEVPAESFDVRMDIIITINEDELSHPYHPLPSCDRE